MKISALTSVLVLAALVISGCGPKPDKEPPKPKVAAVSAATLRPMGAAPAWQLKDVNGNVVSSEQFKGKVVVLDFWATWCPPCRAEIPGYADLQRTYGKAWLVIVGVSVDQAGPGVVKDFMAKFGVNY